MEIDEGWLAPKKEAPPSKPFMEIDESWISPEEKVPTSDGKESAETADEDIELDIELIDEPTKTADEDIELDIEFIDEPTTEEAAPTSTPPVAAEVSPPAAAPAQPALPGVSTPAKATPAIDFGAPSPSAESIDALDRIIEEIYNIDDILERGGVEGPMREALIDIDSRLSAAKASKASIGGTDQLMDVLDRAMAVSNEVKSRDVSEFQSATPASLAALIEGVNNILMPKKAQKYMPAFVKMGDSWTILT
jgi:rubredoxin